MRALALDVRALYSSGRLLKHVAELLKKIAMAGIPSSVRAAYAFPANLCQYDCVKLFKSHTWDFGSKSR